MRWLLPLLMVLSIEKMNAAERIAVTICDLADLPHYLVEEAETQVEYIFHSMGVQVRWPGCQIVSLQNGADQEAWFVIRLRKDGTPYQASELSLHTMGRAFVSKGEGYIADIYSPAVKALSQSTGTEQGWLLGCTIAHELGHLLLGPGHNTTGIMTPQWGDKEAFRISKRWLLFDHSERNRIRDKLHQISGQ